MELLLHGAVSLEGRRIAVHGDTLPEALAPLAPLFDYLRARPRSLGRMIADYRTGSRSRRLAASVGSSLLEKGLASQGRGGPFGPRVTYIVEEGCRQEEVRALKAAVLREGALSPQDAALLWCLDGSGILAPYFAREERPRLKTRLREIRRGPQDRQLAELFHALRSDTALLAGWFAFFA